MENNFDLLKEIETYYKNKQTENKSRDYFYASETGKCEKSIYFTFKKKSKNIEPSGLKAMDNGDYVHARYFKLLAEMGLLVAAEVTPIKYRDLIHGRCDAIITDKFKNYILEIKSISYWSYRNLEKPTEEHEIQTLIYMYLFNIIDGLILYEDKNSNNCKIFELKLDDLNIKKVEDKLTKLKKLKEQIDKNIEPQCNYDEEKCKYCSFKKECNVFLLKEQINQGVEPEDTPITIDDLQY